VGEIGHKISPLCLCVSVVQSDENTEAQRHREFVILSLCLQHLTVHPWMMKKVQERGPGAEGVRGTRAARVPGVFAAGGEAPGWC